MRSNQKFAGLQELLKTDNSIRNVNIQNNLNLNSDDLFNLVYALFIMIDFQYNHLYNLCTNLALKASRSNRATPKWNRDKKSDYLAQSIAIDMYRILYTRAWQVY